MGKIVSLIFCMCSLFIFASSDLQSFSISINSFGNTTKQSSHVPSVIRSAQVICQLVLLIRHFCYSEKKTSNLCFKLKIISHMTYSTPVSFYGYNFYHHFPNIYNHTINNKFVDKQRQTMVNW